METGSSAAEGTAMTNGDLQASVTNGNQDWTSATDLVSTTPADQDVTNTVAVPVTSADATATTPASESGTLAASQEDTEGKVSTAGASGAHDSWGQAEPALGLRRP